MIDLVHIATLKANRLRPTTVRLAVLSVMSGYEEGTHFTIEKIVDDLASSGVRKSVGSVYRTLKEFEDSGIVIRHLFDSIGTVYESNTGTDHDHTVCVVCGVIKEFHKTEFDSLRKEVVSESKGRLIKHTQILYVVCENCL
tara:strand:- start:47 stop:469 length:423 start_codon:yes stop_codon:yes gene_type:complete